MAVATQVDLDSTLARRWQHPDIVAGLLRMGLTSGFVKEVYGENMADDNIAVRKEYMGVRISMDPFGITWPGKSLKMSFVSRDPSININACYMRTLRRSFDVMSRFCGRCQGHLVRPLRKPDARFVKQLGDHLGQPERDR